MADEKKTELAKKVYSTLCSTIDNYQWKYTKDDDKLQVFFRLSGEDIPMDFFLHVDAERQLIRLLSQLPFKMCEEKRMDGAIATCAATYKLLDGSFDYNVSDGTIWFRATASFRESLIGEGLFRYLIAISNYTVDEYNDQFLAINKGLMSISEFLEELG